MMTLSPRIALLGLLAVLALAAAGVAAFAPAGSAEPETGKPGAATGRKDVTLDRGLTAVPGVRVGSVTLEERPTGCTVVLPPAGTIGAVDVRGGAPATRETDLLRAENLVEEVHAVILSGGSAFGLDAAGGVMRYLADEGVGFPVRGTVVPIVVGASLLDLGVGGIEAPDAACGLAAAKKASTEGVERGSVGAGAGATVGKLRGLDGGMKGGLGSASISGSQGLVVAALVAVNAAGDVIDPAMNRVVAGARGSSGELLDARRILLEDVGAELESTSGRDNTTLGVVATNAKLTQAQATKVAQMAHDGFARTIYPSHTLGDGDTIFVLATGEQEGVSSSVIGALAAEVVARSVLDAVRSATSVEGFPSARELLGESDE